MPAAAPEIRPDPSLLGHRDWVAELFMGADAVLSALKQIHVEAGPGLELLAREAASAPSGRLATLSPRAARAVGDVSNALVEEVVDGTFFLALVWASLHTGGGLVASAARILVAANTWTPEKRKRISPWRSLDRAVARLMEPEVRSPLRVDEIVDAAFRRAGMAVPRRTALPVRLADLKQESTLAPDAARIEAAFAATGFLPTRAMLDRLLRASPGLALSLANLYAGYARQAGFGTPDPSRRFGRSMS